MAYSSVTMNLYLCCCYGVDKAGLLESTGAGGDGHLPPRVHDLMDNLPWEILLLLGRGNPPKVQLNIVTKRLHLHKSGKRKNKGYL